MFKVIALSTLLIFSTITGTTNVRAQSSTDEVVVGAIILGLGIAVLAERRHHYRRHHHHHHHHYVPQYPPHYYVPRHHLDQPRRYHEHRHYHHYR